MLCVNAKTRITSDVRTRPDAFLKSTHKRNERGSHKTILEFKQSVLAEIAFSDEKITDNKFLVSGILKLIVS